MKLSQISNLLRVCNTLQDKPLAVKIAYKFAKIKAKLQEDEEFYLTKLQEIIAKYGKTDDNGNYVIAEDGSSIRIKEGMVEDCQKAIEELESIEVELPDIKFTLEELDKLDLTLNQMELFINFIEE